MLLPSYNAHIFMSTLFALTDPALSVMQSAFSTSIYDVVRTLEEYWDTMINAIHIGTLPDTYDLGEYRPHIEVWRLWFLEVISWSLVADAISIFRHISNRILTVRRSSAKSKREKEAGLTESGLPWRSSIRRSVVYTWLSYLKYVRYDPLSFLRLMDDLVSSFNTTLDLVYFCEAWGMGRQNIELASLTAVTILIYIDLHSTSSSSFWKSGRKMCLQISFNPFVTCLILWPVTLWLKPFSSGKLRWGRSMKLSVRTAMDYGGTSWTTLSRLPDSVQQKGLRLFDISSAKGTQEQFIPQVVFSFIYYEFRVGFRIRGEFISESFLRDIMGSITDSIGLILEFTTVPDDRKSLRAYGFLVEVDGEIGMFTFDQFTHHACFTRLISRRRLRSGPRYYQRGAANWHGLQAVFRRDWRSYDKNPQTRHVQRVPTLEGRDKWD